MGSFLCIFICTYIQANRYLFILCSVVCNTVYTHKYCMVVCMISCKCNCFYPFIANKADVFVFVCGIYLRHIKYRIITVMLKASFTIHLHNTVMMYSCVCYNSNILNGIFWCFNGILLSIDSFCLCWCRIILRINQFHIRIVDFWTVSFSQVLIILHFGTK